MDATAKPGTGADVLVVTDDGTTRRVVGEVLEAEGHLVTDAGDGVEAMEVLDEAPVDLVLLDRAMPDPDGIGVLAKVRSRREPGPPIIMLTSRDEADRLAEALDAGADDYVVKPVDRRELVARVRLALRSGGREQEALRAIAEAIARAEPTPEIMDLVARQVGRRQGADAATVVRFESEVAIYAGLWTADPDAVTLFTEPSSLTSGLPSCRVAATGMAARVDDLTALPQRYVRAPGGTVLRGAVAVPVFSAHGLWGAVAVATSASAPVPPDAEARLVPFARLVGLAVDSAGARAALTARAATDSLTGLFNRRVFFERLDAEILRSRRHKRQMSLAIIDIDHFKAVNDTFGHRAGDAVVRELAWRLGDAARGGDVVGRIGGEEFGWLMPETDAQAAWQAAERSRVAVASAEFPAVGNVTISVGVCDLAQAADADDLFGKADAALYWAKGASRDIVCLYSPDVMEVTSGEERARQLRRNQAFQSIRTLARAVDSKDPSTRRHSERVAALAGALAMELGWTQRASRRLREAALVHDVGKIAVPDSLLFRRGPLSPAELARVRTHASLGAEIVGDVFGLERASWVRGHHERWDGAGYPDGLTRDEIPEGARVLHLASVYNALISPLPYQRQLTRREALEECMDESGSQFWPRAVEALEALFEDEGAAGPAEPGPAPSGVDGDEEPAEIS